MKQVLEYAFGAWPIVVGMFVYFVRLEIRLTKICTDLTWIKKGCTGCQQNSDDDSD